MEGSKTIRFPGAKASGALFAAAVFFLYGCFADGARTEYEKAEAHLGEGKYEQALAAYSGVATRFGSSPYGAKSLLRAASIYGAHLGDDDRALKTCSEVIYLYPGTEEAAAARGMKARIYSTRGEHSRAVEEYQALLDQQPEGAGRIRFQVAMEYVKMNDLKQARVELGDLLKRSVAGELQEEVKFQIANTYYLEGDTKEALKGFDGVIKEYPDSPIYYEALFAKARVYDEEGRLAEALEILRGLDGKYPNSEALKTAVEWTEKRLSTDPGLNRR